MTVILGSGTADETLKNIIKEYLLASDYDTNDVTDITKDFVDNTLVVAAGVNTAKGNFGIMIDVYGADSFITATKVKEVVTAEVSNERFAYMTRAHNNVRMIIMDTETVGVELAKNITKGFLESHYDGDRHQIRVDMLNKMC